MFQPLAVRRMRPSEDAETTLVIGLDDGVFDVWQRPNRTRTVEPLYRDALRMCGNIVRFRRDGTRRITSLSLGLGRVYDMRFGRVE